MYQVQTTSPQPKITKLKTTLEILEQYEAKMKIYVYMKEFHHWENLETGPPKSTKQHCHQADFERHNQWKKTISNSVFMMYLKSNSCHTAFMSNFSKTIGFLRKTKTNNIF
jgi:hypothetical protein